MKEEYSGSEQADFPQETVLPFDSDLDPVPSTSAPAAKSGTMPWHICQDSQDPEPPLPCHNT